MDNLGAKTTSTPPLAQVGFRPQWIDLAASHLPNNGVLLTEKRFQEWVRISQTGPSNSIRFHCEQCRSFTSYETCH